jgi:dienelactone hydrolase
MNRADEPPDGNLHVPSHLRPAPDADDVADVPAQDLRAGGRPEMRYLLIGPRAGSPAPAEGFRLLIVMPGGNGGPDFHPFVKRIYRHALSDGYLVAQIVAPEWSPQQAEKLVWPTRANPWPGMAFSTEDLVDAVIDDVGRTHKLDGRYVFQLAWSSSGPAAYAVSLAPGTRITGSYVAMSVFKPAELPALNGAAGHAYFILHSPQDFIPITAAEAARDRLTAAGAAVELVTYEGGHGWRGDVYGNLRRGIGWLESQAARRAAAP